MDITKNNTSSIRRLILICSVLIVLNYFSYLAISLTSEQSHLKLIFSQFQKDGIQGALLLSPFMHIMGLVTAILIILGCWQYFKKGIEKLPAILEFSFHYVLLSKISSFLYALKDFDSAMAESNWKYWLNLFWILIIVILIIKILFELNRAFQKKIDPKEGIQFKEDLLPKNGIRFLHYIIDGFFASHLMIVPVVAYLGIMPYLGGQESSPLQYILFSYLAYFSYYFIAEAISGRTLAKVITNTHVVYYRGNSILGALIRSITRMIPFEPLSIFFMSPKTWHDDFSASRVIKKV